MPDVPEGFIEIKTQRLVGLNLIDGSVNNMTYVSKLLDVHIKYGSTVHFLVYFPDKGGSYLTTDLVVKKSINRRTGRDDENIVLRKFLYKERDVGGPLIFPTIEEFQRAKENDELNESEETIFRTLSRNRQYFIHIEEPELEPDEELDEEPHEENIKQVSESF